MLKLSSKMSLAASQAKFEPFTEGYFAQSKIIGYSYESLFIHLITASFYNKVVYSRKVDTKSGNKLNAYSGSFVSYLGVLRFSNYTAI